jgi:hypothetical protein
VIRTNLIEDLTLIPLPAWWQSPWAMGGFVLLAVALAGLIWGLRRWLTSRPVPEAARPPEPDRTPEFLARLESLKGRRDVLSPHDFALECSDVLREFLEFQTTREFLEAASNSAALEASQRDALGEYLRFCDLVKFARQGATPDEESRLVETAATFVRKGGGR